MLYVQKNTNTVIMNYYNNNLCSNIIRYYESEGELEEMKKIGSITFCYFPSISMSFRTLNTDAHLPQPVGH
jgi:hypothetical protein